MTDYEAALNKGYFTKILDPSWLTLKCEEYFKSNAPFLVTPKLYMSVQPLLESQNKYRFIFKCILGAETDKSHHIDVYVNDFTGFTKEKINLRFHEILVDNLYKPLIDSFGIQISQKDYDDFLIQSHMHESKYSKDAIDALRYYLTNNGKENEKMTKLDYEISAIRDEYDKKMSELEVEREQKIENLKKKHDREVYEEMVKEAAWRNKTKKDALIEAGFSEEEAMMMVMEDLRSH